jgi:hypothetical protein
VFGDISIQLPGRRGIASYWRDVRHVELPRSPVEVDFADIFRNNFIPTSTVLARRTAVEAAGYFDDGIPYGAEDWDLWLRISATGRVLGLPEVLANRVEHSDNLSMQPSQAASVLAVMQKMQDTYPELVAASGLDMEALTARVLFEKGYRYFDRYDFPRARADFLASLRLRFTPRAASLYVATLLGVPVVTGLRRLKRSV